jgi:hypothetical protein
MARFMRNYNSEFTVTSTSMDPAEGSVFIHSTACPAGKRPIGGGGTTDSSDLFITDLTITDTHYIVRWESDDNVVRDPVTVTVTAVCKPDNSTG